MARLLRVPALLAGLMAVPLLAVPGQNRDPNGSPDARPRSARQVTAMLDACRLEPWDEEQAAAWWQAHLPETSTLRTHTGNTTVRDQADAMTERSVETLARS